MELKVIGLSDIEKMQGEHCLIIISNGQNEKCRASFVWNNSYRIPLQ